MTASTTYPFLVEIHGSLSVMGERLALLQIIF